MNIIHLSIVWSTLWPPGKVRHMCVIYHWVGDAGYRHLLIGCITKLTVGCVNVCHFTFVRQTADLTAIPIHQQRPPFKTAVITILQNWTIVCMMIKRWYFSIAYLFIAILSGILFHFEGRFQSTYFIICQHGTGTFDGSWMLSVLFTQIHPIRCHFVFLIFSWNSPNPTRRATHA